MIRRIEIVVIILLSFSLPLIALLLSGCVGQQSSAETQQQEMRKEATNAASSASVERHESKPVWVNASGNAHVQVGPLPRESYSSSVERSAQESSAWDMTFRDAWSQWSAWSFVIVPIGILLLLFAFAQAKRQLGFSSISGGLRVAGSISSIISRRLQSMSPHTQEFAVCSDILRDISDKKTRLAEKAKPTR